MARMLVSMLVCLAALHLLVSGCSEPQPYYTQKIFIVFPRGFRGIALLKADANGDSIDPVREPFVIPDNGVLLVRSLDVYRKPFKLDFRTDDGGRLKIGRHPDFEPLLRDEVGVFLMGGDTEEMSFFIGTTEESERMETLPNYPYPRDYNWKSLK
jgi:hypothetical protein